MLSAASSKPSTSQDSESKGSGTKKSYKSPVNSETYVLRKKRYCNHLTQKKFGKKTLKTLCELLCKPVSVNITKLTTSGTQTCKSNLNKIQKEDASMQKMKPIHNKKETKRLLKTRIISGKDDLHAEQANLHSDSFHKKKLTNIIKEDVNQPLIKLHRIDEVINKIAQSFAKVTTSKECEASVHTTAQTELNESELELPASTSRKEKNLQKCDPKNTRSRTSMNKISKTSEDETRIQTKHTEEYQNESTLSVSESSPLNTVSDAQLNEISQMHEYEANVETECVDETVAELNASTPNSLLLSTAKNNQQHATTKQNSKSIQKVFQSNKRQVSVQTKDIEEIQTMENASVPKLSSLSTSKKDLQNHIIKNTRFRSSINNDSQTNECDTSVQTECIEESQTKSNESVPELLSSTVKKKDLPNRKTRNTRSRTSISNDTETNECETSVQTECIEETQTELSAAVPKSQLLSTDKKDLQNDGTDSIASKFLASKMLQTSECEASTQTEYGEGTQIKSNVSTLKPPSLSIGQQDLQNQKIKSTRFSSRLNKVSQPIQCEASVQTECIEGTQREFNASVQKSPSLSIAKKDLQNNITQSIISRCPVDKNLQTNECEASVQTESIEAQTELNASVSELSSSTIDEEEDLQNRETKSTRSRSRMNRVFQTNESEIHLETRCIDGNQIELNASVPKSSFLTTGNKDLQNHVTEKIISKSPVNKILQTNECEASVQTEYIEEAQTEANAFIPKSLSLSTTKKDLQHNVTQSTISRCPVDKNLQTNECEASMHTESIEAQTELNASVSELSSSTIDKEDLQNREPTNAGSRSSINKVSQTKECETNVKTKRMGEIQIELNASVPKSSLLSTGKKNLENDDIEIIKFISPVDKNLQTNECETSMHTECIEEAETEANAFVLELPSLTIDEEEDLQNRGTKDTRPRSSINKISQTNESETNVKVECIEEIQAELNAFASKSPLLNTGNKDLQNDQTKSINKISQTNEGRTIVQTEGIGEAQAELDASVSKSSLLSTGKKDLQSNGPENITSKSPTNKILQTNACIISVQRECTEGAQSELNASVLKLPSLTIDNEKEDLQSRETENVTLKSSIDKFETSVQTDCIEEIQPELTTFVQRTPSLSTAKKKLPNREIESITPKSSVIEVCQTNEGEASVQTERIGETQTELNASVPKSPSLSTAKTDLPRDRTESTSSKSPINESSQTLGNGVQSSKSDSSDSEEIFRSNNRWRFKRIRKILSDSEEDSDNDDVHDRGLKVTKRLRRDLSEDENETSTVTAKRNIPQAKCTDKNLLQESSQELNVSDEFYNQSKSKQSKVKNKTVRSRNGNGGVRRRRRNNRRSRVSSKLNTVRGRKDTVSLNAENVYSTRIAELVLNNEEINRRSSALDKSLIKKYKLFKELRAVLIRFDSIKHVTKFARISTSPNKYSATKTERLIKAYRNSNLSLERPKLFNYAEPNLQARNENQSTSRPKESVNSTARNLKIVLCKTPTKENYMILNERETPLKLKLLPSKNVPSDTNKKLQQGSSLAIQTASHNLSELFVDKSKKSEQNVTSGLENQRSKKSGSTTASTLPCSPQKSTNKTKEKSGELTTDVRSTKNTDINIFAATLGSLEKKLLAYKIPKKIAVSKQSVLSCTSTHSPTKNKKPVDKQDSRGTLYKCIVCDLCFEDYSELQQHLIVHTQKQSNVVLSLMESINTPSAQPETAALEVSKTSDTFKKKGVKRTLRKPKRSEGNRHRKKKKLCSMVDSNNCSICSQEFVNKSDLAAHIFLHTERELQDACHRMKNKLNKTMEKGKSTKTKEGATENESSSKDNAKEGAEKSSKVVKLKENPVVPVQKDAETLPAQITNVTLCVQNNTDSSGVKKNSSAGKKLVPLLPKPVKEKAEIKKLYTICNCHSKAAINVNCLQIEIVLLCRTCKVLFRSVNCFESHYVLHEHDNCNKYRSQNGRSPNLFCASCGMLFGSVQDVCHHLEMHARFKKDCTTDFRCNICKVVFLGIGSLFYIHWSKHAKDSLWVADESSFPREAILKTVPRREGTSDQNVITSEVSATENYIHVAEYVCNHCKFPFVTEDDLKKHIRRCDTSNSTVRKPVKVKLLCSLCNHDFDKRAELYVHMKDKHMLAVSTPQYFCIGQTPHKVLFICNLCIKTTDNLEDFEDHWVTHNTTNMFFNCMHCKNIYQNSMNAFVEHAREHESETCSTVYAIVSYGKSKFICTRCKIGFSSLQSLNTHLTTHKQKKSETRGTSAQLLNERRLTSALTRVLGLESDTPTVTKQPGKSSQIEAQTVKQATEARSKRPSTESDKEKLLRILEENEDDSEHELVIDLTDHIDEHNELSTGKGNQERQQASTSSNFVSDTSSIGQPCTTLRSNVVNTSGVKKAVRSVTQSATTAAKSLPSVTQNVTVPVSSIESMMSSILSDRNPSSNVSSCSDPLSLEATEISKQLIVHDVESMQNTGIEDTVSAMNQEEAANATTLSTSKKQSPPRPKVGLLRVKTLAELRAPAYQCQLCHAIVANDDELKKHISNHNALNKDNATEKDSPTKEYTLYTATGGKIWNPTIVYTKLQTPPNSSASSSSSASPVYKVAQPPNQPVEKSKPTTVDNQQPQRVEVNVNQNRQPSSASNVTSAYHKNLPASSIIRSIPVPRSSVVRRYGTHYQVTPTTTAQNVSKTFATIAPVSANERQLLSSFIKVMDKDNDEFIYKCKFCEFRSKILSECVEHQLPGTPSSCRGHNTTQGVQIVSKDNNLPATKNMLPNDQNYKQYQPVVNRPGIKPSSSTICYRYPYLVASSSANSNQMVSQNQQILPDTSAAGSASASVYYKNPSHSTGGMSIVINQTAPSVQNIPTIGFLHQTPQQQMYRSQACSEPLTVVDASYLQQSQSQNVSDFSGPSDMYQVANNQSENPNMQETITTYELRLPPGTFVCPHCLSTYMSEDQLQIHINTDHNFICDICNVRLNNFNDLNVHKIKHTLI